MVARGIEERRTEAFSPFEAGWKWKGGAIAGFVAAVVTGVLISVMDLSTLRMGISGLYGLEGSLLAGWVAHLVHGTVFGLLFAVVLADPALYRVSETVWKSVVAGVVFGIVLAVVGAGVIMPMWLNVAGLPNPPTFPNVTTATLVWHLVYGAVLGGLFPFLDDL